MLPSSTSGFRRHLLSSSFSEPLDAVIKAGTSHFRAAVGNRITDRQVAGAAVDVVLTTDGLRQRAAGPSVALAKGLRAAAGASCSKAKHLSSRPSQKGWWLVGCGS